jgi:hypothetical protein
MSIPTQPNPAQHIKPSQILAEACQSLWHHFGETIKSRNKTFAKYCLHGKQCKSH